MNIVSKRKNAHKFDENGARIRNNKNEDGSKKKTKKPKKDNIRRFWNKLD